MIRRKTWRCRIGMHRWFKARNDLGEGFLVCRRCGKEDHDPVLWSPGLGVG